MANPLDRLRHHVSGSIARGEAQAITEITNGPDGLDEEANRALDEATRLWTIRWGNRAEVRRQANSPWSDKRN